MQQSQEQDFEIDLRECARVAIRHKFMVLGAVLVAVVPTALRVFHLPRIYKISMIIEPPMTAITDTGVQSFASAENIKALIESGVENMSIGDELNLHGKDIHFDVLLPKDTRLVEISINEPADKVDLGEKIIAKLVGRLTLRYSEIIDNKQNRIDNEIKMNQNRIDSKRDEIKLKNNQLELFKERERQLVEKIKEAKTNSAGLAAKQETVLERKDNKDDAAVLFYAAAIQQNVNYSTQLQDDLSYLKTKKEDIAGAVDKLKNEINASLIEIGNQNLLKAGVQNIAIIQEPYVSPQPVGPKRKQNILIACLAGLIFGLVSAFSIEWWEKST